MNPVVYIVVEDYPAQNKDSVVIGVFSTHEKAIDFIVGLPQTETTEQGKFGIWHRIPRWHVDGERAE